MIQIREMHKPKSFFIDSNLKFSQNRPSLSSELYHENSKIHPYEVRSWLYQKKTAGLRHTTLKAFLKRSAKSYKLYPSAPQQPLPQERVQGQNVGLWEVMRSRRSLRDYSLGSLQLNDVSTILFYSYGETGQLGFKDYVVGLRAAPSAGSLYPLEIYPLVCGVNGLESGLYHYNVRDHALEFLQQGNFLEQLVPAIQSANNEWLQQAKVILFVTATFFRNQIKYGDRGYRGVLLDAGHLSQNILLSATGLNLAACPLMGCVDDQINDFLEIDGVEESILYAIAIGHPDAQ